jgi:hypothetical protein
MHITASRLFVVVSLIGFLSCTSQDEKSPTVASWNSLTVSEDAFRTQYVRLNSVAPLRDSYEQRRQYAQRLLERKVVAEYADSFRYDTISAIQQSIERTKELTAIKQFIRDEVNPRLSETTEQDIYDAFLRKNTSAKLEQIYAPTQSEIETYYKQLQPDTSAFPSIAAQSMNAVGEQADQFKMGWVGWNQMDLAPEKVAFSLSINEISEPVQSLSGWHIFRAVNKQETFFADQSSYQNAREVVEQELTRRKFEEQSIQYINGVLEQTPIEFYALKINQFWEYLETKLPSNQQTLVQVLNNDEVLSDLFSNPEMEFLAKVGDQPITSQDVLQRLPSIPYWQLNRNFRPAIETVAKDMLFAQKAEEAGYFDHPEVRKETEIEQVRQLYNFFTADVSDTLSLERLENLWYQENRERYISDIELTIKYFTFTDEQSAREALDAFKTQQNWQNVLAEANEVEIGQPLNILRSEQAEHPAFNIQYQPSASNAELQLWGPFETQNGWAFIEIVNRNEIYHPFQEIRDRLKSDMQANIPSITHHFILKQVGFNANEATFNKQLLDEVLPYHFGN